MQSRRTVQLRGDVAHVSPLALARTLDQRRNMNLRHVSAVDEQLPVVQGVERLLNEDVYAQSRSAQVVVQGFMLATEVGVAVVRQVHVRVLHDRGADWRRRRRQRWGV